jgi:proteasome accessory factor C
MSRITASERLQRLLALVPWVAANDGPTLREICDRFDLKERELLADLGLVSMVGVPPYTPDELFDIVVEDGRVWVHLSPSFQRSLRLTPEQALALVAAGATLRAVPGADPTGPLARGLAKLADTLGVDPDEVVDVDLGQASATVLGVLREAGASRHRVRLDYYSHGRDERTEREVDPYRVYADQGQWYVVGFDHLREEERLFRVDRIVDAEPLAVTFEPPAGERDLGLYEPEPDARRVVLDLGPGAAWVVESYPLEKLEDGPDGRVRVTMAISAVPWLERLLLRLGTHAELVAPLDDKEVASARESAAARILIRYRGAVPSPTT